MVANDGFFTSEIDRTTIRRYWIEDGTTQVSIEPEGTFFLAATPETGAALAQILNTIKAWENSDPRKHPLNASEDILFLRGLLDEILGDGERPDAS